jgi:bifunctional enzyme CysN/CysC
MQETELINQDILGYLEQHQKKELLRFVAVGSVDDGKSTLIGRLLHDTHGVYEDQLKAVKTASVRAGLEIDFSLFTDGLKAEREQGITIDVAYRYFSTAKRKFIIADTPGHVQYTRNMATGASTADVVIILIDARLGVLQQSRRHAYIASLLGIPQLAVCINKMDLEGHRREVFERIKTEFSAFADKLGFRGVTFIPVSALNGDNVVHGSLHMDWYRGPTLLQHLENVPSTDGFNLADFRFPVQYVMRPDLNYRGFSGAIASGRIRQGDPIMVLSSGKVSRVTAIDTFEGEIESAHAPMSVTLRLADEIDISRGDMLVLPENRPMVARRFDAMMVWMSEKPLDLKRSYFLKHTSQVVRAEIAQVAYTTDLETLAHKPATHLELNEIGRVTVACHRPLFYDSYRQNRATGAFILIDSLSNSTVAAGMILEREGGAADVESDASAAAHGAAGRSRSQVSVRERWERLGQRGCVVWLAGGTDAARADVAYELERRLFDQRRVAMVIDPHDGAPAAVEASAAAAIPEPTAGMVRSCVDLGLILILVGKSSLRAEREALTAAVGQERVVAVDLDKGDATASADAIAQVLVDQGFVPPLAN